MAATLIQRATPTVQPSGSSIVCAYGSNVTAGNLLVMMLVTSATFPSTISDTRSTSWGSQKRFISATSLLALYAAFAPSSGANTVSVSGGSNSAMFLYEFGNIASTTIDGSGTNSALITSTASETATTTLDNDLLIGIMESGNTGYSPSGFVSANVYDPDGLMYYSDHYKLDCGAHGAQTINFGFDNNYTCMLVAFPSSAPASYSPRLALQVRQAVQRASYR